MREEAAEQNLYRYSFGCELLMGQPYEFYERAVENRVIRGIDLDEYYILISGLARRVYRREFGTSAYLYIDYFAQAENEIVSILQEQGVSCITTMMLYDHSKRFVMVFSVPDGRSAQDVARTVSACFSRLYERTFDMSRTPYRNYTVLSEKIQGYENLYRAFKSVDTLSRQQYFDMHEMIMTPALLQASIRPVSREQIHEDITLLRTAVRERDEPCAKQAFTALFDHLQGARDFELLAGTLHAIRSLADGMLASCGRTVENPQAYAAETYATFAHLREGIKQALIDVVESLPEGPAMSTPVLEAVRYIRNHYAEDISLNDLARHIEMSASWLTKHFNQECMMSVPRYLLCVRMECARKLLCETDMLILEIAKSVGFDNPRYFVSLFKKENGMTPTAYREQMKESG